MAKIIIPFLLLYCEISYSQEGFSFKIDENVYNDIFKQTSNHIKNHEHTHHIGVGAILQASSFQNFPILSNSFVMNYADIPQIIYPSIHFSKEIVTSQKINIQVSPSIGYGFIKQKIIVENYNNIEFKELLSIQWVPINLNFFYEIPQFQFFHTQPSLQLGIQRLWFHHDGKLDGSHYNQTLWNITYGGRITTQITSNIKSTLQLDFVNNPQQTYIHFQQIGFGVWTFI